MEPVERVEQLQRDLRTGRGAIQEEEVRPGGIHLRKGKSFMDEIRERERERENERERE